MAQWFVNSVDGVGGAGDGTSWANAYLTLGAAATAKPAGDTFLVGNNHAETAAAATTITFAGTLANPNQVFCVDHTKPSPGPGDVTTGGSISTTGASNLNFSGSCELTGLTFNAGSGASTANIRPNNNANHSQTFTDCKFVLNNTSASSAITMTNVGYCKLVRPTFQFGAAGQSVTPANSLPMEIEGGTIVLGVSPTTLFSGGSVKVRGFDFSPISGSILIGSPGAGASAAIFDECNPGTNTLGATPSVFGARAVFTRCSNSGTISQFAVYDYAGTETSEFSITRQGGSNAGSTPFSSKIVTTANAKWIQPYRGLILPQNNTLVGSARNVTVYGIWDGPSPSTPPNNDDVWIDVWGQISSGNTRGGGSSAGAPVTTTKANGLATGTINTSDSSTWNNIGGMTNPSPFMMTVALTAQLVGPILILPKAGKASATIYIDRNPMFS
jgi:hypothetical protein